MIPTRNRAAYLEQALRSALWQRFDDFEVVVVDNASSDGTPQVLAAATCDRLRVVSTSPVLPQADNWERAMAEARGEWVVLLGDDDALPPSFLRRLAAVTDSAHRGLVVWRRAHYTHPEWPGPDRNWLGIPPSTGRTEIVGSAAELDRLFARRESDRCPLLGNNAAVRSDVLAEVRAAAGSLFCGPIPDFSLAVVLLALVPDYLFVDRPLIVIGSAASSAGHSVDRRNPSGRAFLAGADERRVQWHVPLTIPVLANLKAESLAAAVAALPPGARPDARLDPVRYLVTLGQDLEKTAAFADVSDERAMWRSELRRLPRMARWTVRGQLIGASASRWLTRGRGVLVARSGLSALRNRLRSRHAGESPWLGVPGERAGLRGIADAALVLEDRILSGLDETASGG